jgi:hypothetical protein
MTSLSSALARPPYTGEQSGHSNNDQKVHTLCKYLETLTDKSNDRSARQSRVQRYVRQLGEGVGIVGRLRRLHASRVPHSYMPTSGGPRIRSEDIAELDLVQC